MNQFDQNITQETKREQSSSSANALSPFAETWQQLPLSIDKPSSPKDLLSPAATPALAALLVAPDKAPTHETASKSYLETWIDAGSSRIVHNDQERATLNQLACGFVKTSALFTGAKLGLLSTFVAYGLDQAHPRDGLKDQAADFMLGGIKGESLKGLFKAIGSSKNLNFAPTKGALMGIGSGVVDELLKRQTFFEPASLNDRLRQQAFNPELIAMNAGVFAAGEGLYSGINYACKGTLAQNRLLSGMVIGGSFGFVNGSSTEAAHEFQQKRSFDTGKVLLHGLLESGSDAAAAGLGMRISAPAFQQKVQDSALGVLEKAGLSPYSQKREFIVTGGKNELSEFEAAKTLTALTTVREVRSLFGMENIGPEKHLLIQHADAAGSIPVPKLADLVASCDPEKLTGAERTGSLFPRGRGPVYLEEGAGNRIRLTLGDQAQAWKNSISSPRLKLSGPQTKFNAMAPLLIGDANNPDGETSRQAWSVFDNQLAQGKRLGLDAISTDVWWGVIEPKQGQFIWNYYDKVSSHIAAAGLKWVPIISMHDCGSNVGDTIKEPVPQWVWNHISSQIPGSGPEVGKFKSEQGNYSSEYPQFWADRYVNPLYKQVMNNFGDHFQAMAQNMSEVNISLGPAGEARYPSYNSHDKGVEFPSRGALQCYSDLAKADFKTWALKKYGNFDGVNIAWGGHVENIEPPVNPSAFFDDNVHTKTQYGRDFFDWYNGTLQDHIQTVMGTAFEVYGNKPAYENVKIGMKIPGIHWRIGINYGDHIAMGDRLAELTAGMITTSQNDWESDARGRGYRPLLSNIKQLMSMPAGNRLTLHFTALEMPDGRDSQRNAQAMPYSLASWVGQEAQRQGIPLKGENALADNLNGDDGWNTMASHLRLPGQAGYYEGLTLLRLPDILSSDAARYNLERLTQASKIQPGAEQRNAS